MLHACEILFSESVRARKLAQPTATAPSFLFMVPPAVLLLNILHVCVFFMFGYGFLFSLSKTKLHEENPDFLKRKIAELSLNYGTRLSLL